LERGKVDETARRELLDRISFTTKLADLADVDFVIEAVPEQLDLKSRIFSELDGILRGDVVLASNTSSLSITELAVRTKRPGKVVGMHFFNRQRAAVRLPQPRGTDVRGALRHPGGS
jgi:3-hydroxybutyryl-CoA dehydrogenase